MKKLFINPAEHRPRAWLRLLLAFGVFILVLLISMAIIAVLARIGIIDAREARALVNNPLVDSLAQLLAAWISYLVAARWLDRRPIVDFGFRFNRVWWRDFSFGLGLGAGLMGLIFGVELAAGWVTVTGTFQSGRSFWSGLPVYVAVFISVGIYEEMLTRGYLLRNLAEALRGKYLNPKLALLTAYALSSIVFGVLHAFNPNATVMSTISLAGGGLFLGLGYILTGDLAVPIGLHITWNFFQGNVFGFPVSGNSLGSSIIAIDQKGTTLITGGAFGPEAGLIGLAAIALGSLIIWFWVRKTRGTAKLAERLAIYTVP